MCSIMKAVAVAAVCSICSISQATVLTLQADFKFSGTAPSLPAPWLTATFDDHDTPGSVTLKLSTTNLTGGQFVSGWYLNIDPALDVGSLVFSAPTKVGSFDSPTISLGEDAFKAGSDGYYDIKLAFSTSGSRNGSHWAFGSCNGSPWTFGSRNGSHRFGVGESVSYTITGIPTLTEASFNFESTHGGGAGEYVMAAHVQGIGCGGCSSGWVASAPEPATMALLAFGGLALLRRKPRFSRTEQADT